MTLSHKTTPPGKPGAGDPLLARALELLIPDGQVTELRAPKAGVGRGRTGTVSGYFDDRDELATFLQRSGLFPTTVVVEELPDARAVIRWVAANMGPGYALCLDPIDAEASSLRVMPVAGLLAALRGLTGE